MTKDYPRAAIVIPTYNRAGLIGRTLRSALRQNYPNFEVAIIDDGRDDETEKIVRKLKDSRITYVHNATRGNLPKARNQGVRTSSADTKYVAFLDDDNELLPEFLSKGVAPLEADGGLAGVVPMSDHRFDDGTRIGVRPEMCEKWDSGLGNGSLLRKELFTRDGVWFNEDLASHEDWDFGVRVHRSYAIGQLPDILQIYYHHYPVATGSTLSTTLIPLQSIEYLFDTYRDYYIGLGRKPLATFYFRLGMFYCRAGATKKGRAFFVKAFMQEHKLIYLAYYIFWLFPWFARNFHLENVLYWKCRLRDKFKRAV